MRQLATSVLALVIALMTGEVHDISAQSSGSPMHPLFPLLDRDSVNVLVSGGAVSPMTTCGACHDASFIAGHSSHADAGLASITAPGTTGSGLPWDFSNGPIGRWDLLTNAYLTPANDARVATGTPDWVRDYAARLVGGGPAVWSRDRHTPLLQLRSRGPDDPQASAVDPTTGNRRAWSWKVSGVAEMDCFLCHTPNPAHAVRVSTLRSGAFAWAATATLVDAGIVSGSGSTWHWNRDAFDRAGNVRPDRLPIQDPTSSNCGQCHGIVDPGLSDPVVLDGMLASTWRTYTTGEVFSPQRISLSGINLRDKQSLDRSWDVHAERLLDCTDCHYSVSNPVYRSGSDGAQPEHLKFDARRMPIGVYLRQPSHYFAGEPGVVDAGVERGCEACHDPAPAHQWLPYAPRHMEKLACTACHTPRLTSVAAQVVDWTVIDTGSKPRVVLRGANATNSTVDAATLVEGFEPVLLPRVDGNGTTRLAPYNLVTSWHWVAGQPERPVSSGDLATAFLANGAYRPEIVEAFDSDGDGRLEGAELILDSPAKVELVRGLLSAQGLEQPRVTGEVRPYPVNHGVAPAEWATWECRSCHSRDSRLEQPVLLAGSLPDGVLPAFAAAAGARLAGRTEMEDDGRLVYRPDSRAAGLYVLGHSAVHWANVLGLLAVLGVLVGALVHAGVRLHAVRGTDKPAASTDNVYMYTVYERFWHWLQALAILLLVLTGLEIHFTGIQLLGFSLAVGVHNIVGFVVVANAVFAALYNLASGEIRRFLPEPRGFFGQAIAQARYYLSGIFRGEPHPFQKRPGRRLNPLQQVTYLAILNLLLPLQIVTGLLIWGAQRWPGADALVGGLTIVAPVHAFGAWMFAAFFLLHIYLTTTGHTPTANIKAMIMGWETSTASDRPVETT